jgi:hypothetical protein
MSSPVLWGPNSTANNLQDALGFGNGAGPKVIAPAIPVDPTATATDGVKGSLYLNSTAGILYQKQDNGTTTNWAPFVASSAASASVYATNSLGISANAPFQFDGVTYDTTGGWSTTTYDWTSPSTGLALVTANIFATAISFSANIFVNGINVNQICYVSAAVALASGAVVIPVIAGDTVSIRPDSAITQSAAPGTMHAEFSMIWQASAASIPAVGFAASEGTGAQTFPSGSGAAITFNTVEFDTALAFSGNTFTVPYDGDYFVQSQILWQSNASGGRQLDIFVNGVSRCTAFDIARGGGETPGIVAKLLECVVGDTITIVAQQDSGATLSLFTSDLYNWVSISRIAPQVSGGGGGGGSGITRSISSISSPTTLAAAALTDYVALVSGTTTITLPTAVGNTNRYTVKNAGAATVTVAFTGGQTADGNATITLAPPLSVDLISDNSNWSVI